MVVCSVGEIFSSKNYACGAFNFPFIVVAFQTASAKIQRFLYWWVAHGGSI
jgi:hypothetical protein